MKIDKKTGETSLSLERAIYERRTVRKFRPDPVPKEILEKVIKAGIAAPSPLNSQPWHFTVVAGEKRDELVKVIRKFPVYLADILALNPKEAAYVSEESITEFAKDLGGAPAIIFVTIPKKTSSYAHKIDLTAAGAAIQNMQLVAWSLGLGTVCLTSALWVETEIMLYLKLKGYELVTVMPIGYRAEEPGPMPRNPDVTTWTGL